MNTHYYIIGIAIGFAVTGCAGSQFLTGDSQKRAHATAEIDHLISERELSHALRTIDRMLRDTPQDSRFLALRGDVLYRMHRFSAAADAYRAAWSNDAGNLYARHREWAAMRAAAPGDAILKKQIAAEIEAFITGNGNDPDALFAAYHGYDYLRMTKRKRLLLRRVVNRNDSQPNPAIASTLVEEMLVARDPEDRIWLAERYIEHFSNGADVNRVAALLIKSLSRKYRDDMEFLAAVEPYLMAQSEFGIWTNPLAKAWLARGDVDRAAHVLNTAHLPPRPTPFEVGSIPDELQTINAEQLFLRGSVAQRRGQLDLAARHFDAALRWFPRYAAANSSAGEIAALRGDSQNAVNHFVAALTEQHITSADRDLRGLLREQYGLDGDPAVYFANRDGVVRFDDVTDSMGLSRVTGKHIAWGDYDNDDFADLLIDGNHVLRNAGGERFTTANDEIGIPRNAHGLGVWADTDDDGDLDLLSAGPDWFELWRNDGSRFTAITEDAFATRPHGPVAAMALGDLDGDRGLDLYIVSNERRAIERGFCVADQLYQSRGNNRFVDTTARRGLVTDEPYCGRGVTLSDIDDDGDTDILVANYRLDPNVLWENRANGSTFVDVAATKGFRGHNSSGYYGHSLGSATGDVDGDGYLDIFVSNLAHPRYASISDVSQLLINAGPPRFEMQDRWRDAQIGFEESSADPILFDADNDADLDLFFTAVYRGATSRLYLNNGRGEFRDVTWLSGARVDNAWGVAAADFDNDGNVDLAIASPDGLRLLKNRGVGNHWLGVRVRDVSCNRYGVGAKITVSQPSRRQTQEVVIGRGSGNQDALTRWFGLASYNGPVTVALRNVCQRWIERRVVAVDRTVTVP